MLHLWLSDQKPAGTSSDIHLKICAPKQHEPVTRFPPHCATCDVRNTVANSSTISCQHHTPSKCATFSRTGQVFCFRNERADAFWSNTAPKCSMQYHALCHGSSPQQVRLPYKECAHPHRTLPPTDIPPVYMPMQITRPRANIPELLRARISLEDPLRCTVPTQFRLEDQGLPAWTALLTTLAKIRPARLRNLLVGSLRLK